ncbi:zinc ribbon domain-containing protein [Paraburkholderia sp. CNPSo 3274]|uniref:FmdB family zinc ribbon protein n=1 Tax=Paraburkholderia sp. CNPSo 3274 TaxID=2940932 RepID=UPI0020B63D76|nr:FmdB family zinc ribbon protein [Paraburkholderia sp. CNPSo 3274]MCP3707811.1 zinc ribbon domain-containing protein [Paraburkholderia sp. CNPSo 3274]
MPIYAYRCESCGFDKDVLQKMSDAPLTQCPSCGADTFRKQVTAAGFQLKGSGWYVTDFRSGNGGKSGAATGAQAAGENASSSEASKPAGEGAASASSDANAAAPAASSPASTPSPAAST